MPIQFLFIGPILLCLTGAVAAQEPPGKYSNAILKLDAAVRYEHETKNLGAVSIAVVDDQSRVWSKGFGFQDGDRSQPATGDSVYRVGSISKLFTDIAVLQLVDGGVLDLDTPIQHYLPDFHPENPWNVPLTLRQMMSHQSGLVRESPVGNYFDPNEPSLTATVQSLNRTKLVYRPMTRTKYSNAAIAVVGAVLESKLLSSHPERVQNTILAPLGMENSGFTVTPELKPHLVTGWMRTYDGRRFEAPDFLLGTGPAGNLYSSVNDLAAFVSCLFRNGETNSGHILSPTMLGLMQTPVKDAQGRPQKFGLGFHIDNLDGYRKIGHGGAVYGFSTQLEVLPERKLGVIAVASLDGTNGVVGRLAEYALRLMIAVQENSSLPAYRTTTDLPGARSEQLIGRYCRVDGTETLQINELHGRTFMQKGVFRHELRAAADDGSIIVDDEISFGTPIEVTSAGHIRVGKTSYTRRSDAPPAAPPKRWKGLIGEYGWDHNTLYILEDAGQLYALIEWFYYYPLTEVDVNTFQFPDYGLYHGECLTFTRNDAGYATEVNAAEVHFIRRDIGVRDGETFRINPTRPIDELRADALNAAPPQESGSFRETKLSELVTMDDTIKLDIRYASTNNFTGAVFYKQPKAFMQQPAAEGVTRANGRLKARELGLLIHDAYRPWHVTKMFWDATPDNLKQFVANPERGSRHNRGCAVDLTLYDRKTGNPIQMVAGYDEFSPRSYPLYPGGTSRQRWYRDLLRRTMEAEGFSVYRYEWWHFDYQDWKKYRIENATFEELGH